MKIDKELATFLAKEGVLTKFINNHIERHGGQMIDIICGVGEGFLWCTTPEGSDFWAELQTKYNTYYNENN
jgi:hypothetical protein